MVSIIQIISQQSSVVGTNFLVQVIRAVTKLQKAFITFYNPIPNALDAEPFRKPSIYFHHPMDADRARIYNPNYELQINLQFGSKLYPEYPTNNLSECFYRLREALNLPDKRLHAISINYKDYIRNKFVFCADFQRVPGASYTGINTKAEQVLMVNVKAVDPARLVGDHIANTMYTLLQAEQILEIRDVGCTVYD
jgi:hypothetical protein